MVQYRVYKNITNLPKCSKSLRELTEYLFTSDCASEEVVVLAADWDDKVLASEILSPSNRACSVKEPMV